MRKNIVYILLILVSCVIFPKIMQGNPLLSIENITQKNGIPNGSVNCIAQDSLGFVWIGTWKGLYRYDGYSTINFSSINTKFNGLKINTLHIENNNLWVGSFVTGLFKIDLETYEISHYDTKTADPAHCISDDNVLCIESMNDGTIIIGTERGGINIIYSEEGKAIENINTENAPSILQKKQVSQIVRYSDRKIVIASNYITAYDIDTKESQRLSPYFFDTYITKIKSIGNNDFLVASVDGLFKLSQLSVNQILDIRVNAIEDFRHDELNDYLIGTTDGLYLLNKSGQIEKLYMENGYSNQITSSILKISESIFFIGSESGLSIVTQRAQHFNSICRFSNDQSETSISRIIKYNGQIFAASWGKGLLKIDERNQEFKHVKFSNDSKIQPEFIYDLSIHKNRIFLSCKNHHGIFSFNPSENEPCKLDYKLYFTDSHGDQKKYVATCIYSIPSSNTLIVGTWEGVLFYFDEQHDKFTALTDKDGNLAKSENLSIFSIIEDHLGNIWVGISGGGVLCLRINNGQIVSEKVYTEADGLTSNFVTQIYQSRNKQIWIGSEKGLSVIDGKKAKPVFKNNQNFDIQSIIEDPIGYLWIGTPNGLMRINSNRTDEPYRVFDSSDGLNNNAFFINSVYCDENSVIYFGGLNGIDYFVPYKIEYNYKKEQPIITRFDLFNESLYPTNETNSGILKKNIQLCDKIKLKYDQNTFSIEIGNITYKSPNKCQFAYMLEGLDKDWNYRNANNRVAYYTELSPGSYTFKVRSTNNDGLWCNSPTQLLIEIKPPFWANTVAYIGYFVVAMLIVFWITYSWVVKIDEKHKMQMKEIEFTKQKEIDEVKLKFFTNISHELRTPLTLILGPIAQILKNDPGNAQADQHLMIYRNAHRLLQLTNRILDFKKAETAQLTLKVELTRIDAFLKNIFLFFNYEAKKRDIDYQFNSDFNEEVWIDTEFLESITFNLLSNAFKYTPNGKSIMLSIHSKDESFIISIADTGIGMTAEQMQQLFSENYLTSKHNSTGIGLNFTKRLVEIHKGKISVNSKIDEGSQFIITLPATDVYTQREKASQHYNPSQIDWAQFDQSEKAKIDDKISQLKEQFNKDKLLILVVDDNFEIRQFLRSLLSNEFDIIEASDGRDAFDMAIEHIPDLVISDVMMQSMSGIELCDKLKEDERTDHIPIILTTILSDQQSRIEGIQHGADSYIPKPIDPNHLLARVHKLIEKELKIKERFSLDSYEKKKEDVATKEVHPLIEKARKIVLENIDNSEYNIDNFCNDIGLSRMQVYRKFKALMGISANSFIRKVRLHRAAELLKDGNTSVKEVTYDVGFSDLKYFRKCFFEEFGVNPSEYGNESKNKKSE